MIPERSTSKATPLSLLDIVQRGGTEDRKRLYERCRDPAVSSQLAAALRLADPDLIGSARVWKYLLEDLHPNVTVELPELPDRGRARGSAP